MNDDEMRGVWTGVIWMAGAVLLYVLWNTHPQNKMLDGLLDIVLYVVCFFYFAAVIPIHRAVARWVHPRVRQ